MLSIDIKDYLIAQAVGTSSTIFAAEIPADIDTAILVTPTAGGPPDIIVDLEYPHFQLMARSKNAKTASDLLKAAMVVLHQATDLTINGLAYNFMNAISSNEQLGKDELQRWMYVQNYAVIKEVG